jgi:hypothetical protein
MSLRVPFWQMSVPLSKEQKLTQRMQRKAESARVARLRKKEVRRIPCLICLSRHLRGTVDNLSLSLSRALLCAPSTFPGWRSKFDS